MEKDIKIALIGAGNVASVLAPVLQKAGYSIIHVWSRHKEHAQVLAQQLHTCYSHNIKDVPQNANVYLIAVKDDSLADIARQLPHSHTALYLHTAGNQSISVLKSTDRRYWGVLYPLQTFTKDTPPAHLQQTSFFIEGNCPVAEERTLAIANKISRHVYPLTTSERLKLHLAGVFANNFTNCLYIITEKMLNELHLPFSVLIPMIETATLKLQHVSPLEAQTGPARRGDKKVIAEERQLLTCPSTIAIYDLLSQYILNQYHPSATNTEEQKTLQP